MKLFFNIIYKTAIDERLVLNVTAANGTVKSYAMRSGNSRNWVYDINTTATTVEYYYSVECAGKELRHEWCVVPHRLELDAATKAKRCTVYDWWIDTPEDAYKYSSAFTDCINNKNIKTEDGAVNTSFSKTLCLKVRCPQVGKNSRLA